MMSSWRLYTHPIKRKKATISTAKKASNSMSGKKTKPAKKIAKQKKTTSAKTKRVGDGVRASKMSGPVKVSRGKKGAKIYDFSQGGFVKAVSVSKGAVLLKF